MGVEKLTFAVSNTDEQDGWRGRNKGLGTKGSLPMFVADIDSDSEFEFVITVRESKCVCGAQRAILTCDLTCGETLGYRKGAGMPNPSK
jgi:hypothetical protein